MLVTKRSGAVESVDLSKITNSLTRIASTDLNDLDIYKIAITTISGLYDKVSTRELDLLSIKTAASLSVEDNLYSKLAARLLSGYIKKEVQSHDIMSFSQSIKLNHELGLISDATHKFVCDNSRKLDNAINDEKNKLFEYYGLQTVYDRYLLKHPTIRTVTEEPQYWLMRVACGLSESVKEAIEFYNLLSSHEYMTSTPTLFNSGTKHSQMSSCFIAGTQVATLTGTKNIETVSIGDMVVTHKGNIKPVSQIHKNPLNSRTVFEIKCYNTPIINVTDNHKFWSVTQEELNWGNKTLSWHSAQHLRKGDYISIPNWVGEVDKECIDLADYLHLFQSDGNNVTYHYTINPETIDVESKWVRKDHLHPDNLDGIAMAKKHTSVKRYWTIDEDFALFLGIWYGDGSTIHKTNSSGSRVEKGIGIVAHRNNKQILDFCSEYAERTFGVPTSFDDCEQYNWIGVSFNSTLLGYMFTHLFGKKFDGKKLYPGCFKWKRNLVFKLLSGLISTDGCVTGQGSIVLQMSNLSFMKDLYMVCRNLGIPVSYRKPKLNGKIYATTMSIPSYEEITNDIIKVYGDDRLDKLKNSSYKSTSIIEIDNNTLVQITSKNVSSVNAEFVYTLGVEDDHSYNVEGLVCENCYLLDSPQDDLKDIYKRYADIAMLSKWAGGIGLSYSRVRGSGSLIKGTNGKSNGIIPFIHVLDSSIKAVNQCFSPMTPIKTNKGEKYICELVKGDQVITTSGYEEIEEVLEGEYDDNIIRIKTNYGDALVTPEHPLLVVENVEDINNLHEKIQLGIVKPRWKSSSDINISDIILEIDDGKENSKRISV